MGMLASNKNLYHKQRKRNNRDGVIRVDLKKSKILGQLLNQTTSSVGPSLVPRPSLRETTSGLPI